MVAKLPGPLGAVVTVAAGVVAKNGPAFKAALSSSAKAAKPALTQVARRVPSTFNQMSKFAVEHPNSSGLFMNVAHTGASVAVPIAIQRLMEPKAKAAAAEISEAVEHHEDE